MEYKYTLSSELIETVSNFYEFANGGTQVTVLLKNGETYSKILIFNSSAIIAIRGYKDLPFEIDDIKFIYQTNEDKNPKERNNWQYWGKWK